jgi:glycine/D-amino acid oxidase-like deaminating enzyme/nitrite reductase/ring-hydroxylating ferredoxin subunit
MKRDGYNKSLWQEIPSFQAPETKTNSEKTYDVLIAGGGITGLTTALLLQEQGLQCVLAEARSIGFGSTGGTTAHLNTLLDTPYYEITDKFGAETTRLVARGARVAIDFIEAYCMKHKIACELKYKTGYLFSQTENEAKELLKIKEGTEEAGIVADWATSIPTAIPYRTAIAIARQAQFHPTKYLVGLAKAYVGAGGVLLENCAVKRCTEVSPKEVNIETTLGTIKAHRLVYATHIPPGVNNFNLRCAAYRSYAIAVTLSDEAYPDALLYDMREPYNYYRSHATNGNTYLIAGGYDHKTGHTESNEQKFRELEAHIRQLFSVDAVAYKWSSQYYVPVDGLPYIGRMPGHDSIYVATGFGGNGMVLGTLSGLIISALISGKTSLYADIFSPSRIKPAAGLANFIKENADVVSQFVGRRFSYDHINALADVAPGQAIVTNWEGQKIAMFRDDNGKLLAVDPVCPHGGCLVSWNSTERTWDCPCHGSRYAPDGTLLAGPAQKGLQQLEWNAE